MRRYIKHFIALFFAVLPAATGAAFAQGSGEPTFTEICMTKVSQDTANFTAKLFSDIFKGNDPTQNLATVNKSKILDLIAQNVTQHCTQEIPYFDTSSRAQLPFRKDDQDYVIDFDINEMFEYTNTKSLILVYNKRNLQPGNIIKYQDIEFTQRATAKGVPYQWYWSNSCVDPISGFPKGTRSAVNNIFGDPGKGNRYALQTSYFEHSSSNWLPKHLGQTRRLKFPGTLMSDGKSFHVVTETNLLKAKADAEAFAGALRKSDCANQGLAVYVVSEIEYVEEVYPQVTVLAGPYNI